MGPSPTCPVNTTWSNSRLFGPASERKLRRKTSVGLLVKREISDENLGRHAFGLIN